MNDPTALTDGGVDDEERDPAEPFDDPAAIEPQDIGPMGALIVVAFTGAIIAGVGFVLAGIVGDAALVFVVLGLAVVAASPVAYLRFREL